MGDESDGMLENEEIKKAANILLNMKRKNNKNNNNRQRKPSSYRGYAAPDYNPQQQATGSSSVAATTAQQICPRDNLMFNANVITREAEVVNVFEEMNMEQEEENKKLTAYDIMKDSVNTVTKIEQGKTLLNKIIETYFIPNTKGWQKKLARIEQERLFSNEEQVGITNICWLRPVKISKRGVAGGSQAQGEQAVVNLPQGITFAALPEVMKVAIKDSGDDPKKIKSDICEELNAGSAFDPATRKKDLPMYVPTITIPHSVFVLKGMGKLVESISFTPPTNQRITITIRFYIYLGTSKQTYTFSSQRDENFDFIPKSNTLFLDGGSNSPDLADTIIVKEALNPQESVTIKNTDFFSGNNEKNSWFNNQDIIDNKNILIGTLFVMCKELGDFLQGLLLHMYLGPETDNRAALFTSDKVLAVRCIQDRVDVVIQEPYDPNLKEFKNLGRAKYLTSTIEANALLIAQKNALKKIVHSSNEKVIIDIDNILRSKNFMIGGQSKTLTPSQEAFLNECKSSIFAREAYFITEVMKDIYNYDDAYRLADSCIAMSFISKGIKITYSKNKLFKISPSIINDGEKIDPLAGPSLTKIFSESTSGAPENRSSSVVASGRRIVRGGGKEQIYQQGGTFSELENDDEYYTDPTIKVLLAIGKALSKRKYKVFENIEPQDIKVYESINNGYGSSGSPAYQAALAAAGNNASSLQVLPNQDILLDYAEEIEAIYSILLPVFYYAGIQPYNEEVFEDFFFIHSSEKEGIYDLTELFDKSIIELADIFNRLENEYQKEKEDNFHLYLDIRDFDFQKSSSFGNLAGNLAPPPVTTTFATTSPANTNEHPEITKHNLSHKEHTLEPSSTSATNVGQLQNSQETERGYGSSSGTPPYSAYTTKQGTPHSYPSPAALNVKRQMYGLISKTTTPTNRFNKTSGIMSRGLLAAQKSGIRQPHFGISEENNLGGGGKRQTRKKRVCKKTRKVRKNHKKQRQTKRKA